ncbi:Acyl-coenzyme A thioesterase 9, partial [Lachnellula arida]
MSNRISQLPRLTSSLRATHLSARPKTRAFSACARCRTDGVYRELTAMRTSTPFIEAFKKQRDEKTKTQPVSTETQPVSTDKVERDLSPKTMQDSHTKVVSHMIHIPAQEHTLIVMQILPLARDPWLLDKYINSSGHIRLGTIFMDLDALAGVVAYKHTGDSVMTVTAAVDRITLTRPLTEICDLELSGQVTFATGRSSMEVSLQVAKAAAEGETVKEEDILMTCAFTMVSLDPATKKSVPISPPQNHHARRKTPLHPRPTKPRPQKSSPRPRPPKTSPQRRRIRPNPRPLAPATLLARPQQRFPQARQRRIYRSMKNTQIQSVQIMQPQYRNRHNFMIFGGFLLKSTFELAFTCASSISHTRPKFIALDPSTFENPVPVGSVLYLTATVAYSDVPLLENESNSPTNSPANTSSNSNSSKSGRKTSPQGTTRVQIRVDSKVKNVEHDGETKPTGVFNYTFEVGRDVRVIPESYAQFMMFLDARRRCLVLDDQGPV